MVSQREIVQRSKKHFVTPATIDKDWVLGHLLNAFYSFEDIKSCFVFKGGTCLKKCYFEDYRFSEDLDFTLLDKDFTVDVDMINKVAGVVEKVSNIKFFVSEIKNQIHNDIQQGYEVKIKFWGADHKPNTIIPPANRWQTYVKLDISFSENMFNNPVYRKIIHPYSDSAFINKTIPAYPMVEIMAEKLRSLIQRNRPRDIYDIWYIMKSNDKVKYADIKELLFRKAKLKDIEILNIEQFVNQQKQQKNRRAWESSLKQHLPVNALPDFDMVYPELFEIVNAVLKS